ncbi:MAG: hypothetical protein HC849_09935 [Oscillatoriales cyanobacterium RU_3_3]|nr:hypothetical protein [Microcoleus sp. SU_5_6]NJL68419.1 hypothetical protein [Microcoleus sp. SM1_3_4]NJM60439.1 hypothetical protein [Oscillatoriales cyanobacterium RU_3_3]NJR25943.1 hypothetical protein [Richelia sp. CSU_2_1]
MNIKVKFDERLLSKFIEGSSPLLFEITWEHDRIEYPMKNWSDFGLVILGWWIGIVIKLFKGEERGEFLFMDGPYSVTAKYDREIGELELSPKGLDVIWKVQYVDFVKMLIDAVKQVDGELAKRGIGKKERQAIEKYSAILKGCLVEQKIDLPKAGIL